MVAVNSSSTAPPPRHRQVPVLPLPPATPSHNHHQPNSGNAIRTRHIHWLIDTNVFLIVYSGHAVQLGDLQNILSSMNIPNSPQSKEGEWTLSLSPPPPFPSLSLTHPLSFLTPFVSVTEENIGLNDVITSDVLRPLSSDGSVQEQLESHIPHTSESVADVLTSPQFQQALGVFGSALQSGQLGPLMSQFGMGQEVVSAADTGSRSSNSAVSVYWLLGLVVEGKSSYIIHTTLHYIVRSAAVCQCPPE